MDDAWIGEVLRAVAEQGKIGELYHVTHLRGYRENAAGQVREVNIEVLDRGPGSAGRYQIVATDTDGRVAAGNPEDDLRLAARVVHWNDLDRDPGQLFQSADADEVEGI